MGNYFTYITTNLGKTVLYTGMTNNLEQRIIEHYLNRGNPETFAGRYYCYLLLHFERYPIPIMAIDREKEIKRMSRKQKEELVSTLNPRFEFLNKSIMKWPPSPDASSRNIGE